MPVSFSVEFILCLASTLCSGAGLLLPNCAHWLYLKQYRRAVRRVLLWLPVGTAIAFLAITASGVVVVLLPLNNDSILTAAILSVIVIIGHGAVLIGYTICDIRHLCRNSACTKNHSGTEDDSPKVVQPAS